MRSKRIVTLQPVTDMRATALRRAEIRLKSAASALRFAFFSVSLTTLAFLHLRAEDWPQFLGPHRNGAITETNLASTWPKEGPPVLWQRKAGEGFSGPVVSGNRLIFFHRIDGKPRRA